MNEKTVTSTIESAGSSSRAAIEMARPPGNENENAWIEAEVAKLSPTQKRNPKRVRWAKAQGKARHREASVTKD